MPRKVTKETYYKIQRRDKIGRWQNLPLNFRHPDGFPTITDLRWTFRYCTGGYRVRRALLPRVRVVKVERTTTVEEVVKPTNYKVQR